MAKWLIRAIVLFVLSTLLSSLGLEFSENFFPTLFNVLGIMFSVGISQILTFSFSDVSNDEFVEIHRKELKYIRNVFIALFVLSGILFLLCDTNAIANVGFRFWLLSWNFDVFVGSFYFFCIIFFIENFLDLIKLKNDIDDKIRKIVK